MDLGLSGLLVGVISTVGGIIVALIQKFRRENREDHDIVQQQIGHVYRAVTRVEDLVHDHIRWHGEVSRDGSGKRNRQRSKEDEETFRA